MKLNHLIIIGALCGALLLPSSASSWGVVGLSAGGGQEADYVVATAEIRCSDFSTGTPEFRVGVYNATTGAIIGTVSETKDWVDSSKVILSFNGTKPDIEGLETVKIAIQCNQGKTGWLADTESWSLVYDSDAWSGGIVTSLPTGTDVDQGRPCIVLKNAGGQVLAGITTCTGDGAPPNWETTSWATYTVNSL